MQICHLEIKNFRGLEDVQAELLTKVSVIVGPNAAGKTTIMEAIRLVKSLLAPRTQSESSQVLFALGAASPHAPQRLHFQAVARDASRPVIIGCSYQLTEQEIADLVAAKEIIARTLVQVENGSGIAAQDILIQFFSSPFGQERLKMAKERIDKSLNDLQRTGRCKLEITWNEQAGPQATSGPVEAQFIGFLERRLPPNKTAFTYFPADRALPFGEQPVQLGGADSNQQLESYNSQPQLKFARLKNLIFSGAIFAPSEDSQDASLQAEFERIFSGVLKGRSLERIQVNDIGLLSVVIRDTESGRTFDIDGMSSGEKGLILTFLLLQRSVMRDGIVLLDEPELHLNPAVCKDLLSYLIDEYVRPKGLQFIICSHSPEILAGAFDSDQCSLYHLAAPNNLSKVRIQDETNLEDTLRRLGATESENLLYKGIVFVEGVDDISILEAGFGALLRRYKLKQKQGRHEVEKAIKRLQEIERAGTSSTRAYFIFDRDEAPTSLQSSCSVKILQWDRRCLENYFIDLDAMANVLMSPEMVKNPLANHGEVSTLLKDLAFKQIPEIAAKRVFERYAFEGIGVRKEDVRNKDIDDISEILLGRIERLKGQLANVDSSTWRERFKSDVEEEVTQVKKVWEATWKEQCDGKRLIEDLSKSVVFQTKIRNFKIRMIKEMAINQADGWKTIERQLRGLFS